MKRINEYGVYLCAFAGILFLGPAGSEAGNTSPAVNIASSREQARMEWEWTRLRNPATNNIPPNFRERELQFAARASVYKPSSSNYQWVRRGPFNIGGRTRALAVDVINEQVLLAGGVSGGMWRSTNQGTTWSRVTPPGDIQTVTCVAQDNRPAKTNVWYYGTGEVTGNSTRDMGGLDPVRGNGIFKSTNGGVSWTALPSTVSQTPQKLSSYFQYINKIALDPSNSTQDELYAAAAGAILRSTDGGATWTRVLGAQDPTVSNASVFTDVAVSQTGVVYATLGAGVDQGIWRSTDGIQWNSITPANWPPTEYVMIGIAPSNEKIVYFFAYASGYGVNDGILAKWDGSSWTDLSLNLPQSNGTDNLDLQGGYNMVIKVWPQDENIVFLGDVNLWRSTDGFSSSINRVQIGGYSTDNKVNLYPNHHPDQHVVVFLPSNPSVLFSGSDGGVSVTQNCRAQSVKWNYLNNGFYTSQFYDAAMDHTTTSNVIIGGMQDWGTFGTRTTDPSVPWNWFFPGDGGLCEVADGGAFFYGAAQQGNIFIGYSAADGNLSNYALLTPSGGQNFRFVTPYIMDPNNNKIIYVGAGGTIWRNSDVTKIPLQNNSPTSINYTNMSNASLSGGNISAFGISKTPANILYYGTDTGSVYRVDNANSGNPSSVDVWTGKGFPANAYVNCIAVDPSDAQKAIATFSNYEVKSVFYTTNGGNTWASISGNLEQNPDGTGAGPSVRCATVLHFSAGGTAYYAGTSTGVYSTSNLQGDSTVWTHESPDLIGNMVVDSVDSRETDNLVIAATHGGGVFSAYATPLEPPSNVHVSDVPIDNGHFVKVTWALSPSDRNGAVSWYRIFQSRSDVLTDPIPKTRFTSPDSMVVIDAHFTILVDSVAAGVAEYTSFVPVNGETYYFWLQTVGPGGVSKMAAAGAATSVAETPIAFSLSAPYPNPFNPSTTIQYFLPQDARVALKIYTVTGQQVAVLENGMEAAGKHAVVWNASGIPSGVYLFILSTGEATHARKMVLLK